MKLSILTVLLSCPFALCQEKGKEPDPAKPPVAQAPDPEALLREMLARFAKEKIEVDRKEGWVAIPAVVNEPADPIEYLLIHRRGKRHEAMFFTTCRPSVLNGALLLIGLEPGRNASAEEIDPPPSLEEIRKGAETVKVTPPEGRPFWMTVRWKDVDGKQVEHCVEDLIFDLTTQRAVEDCRWVYLGGRMAKIYKNEPEVFVADYEGNLVSVCYLMPDNHLATMVHERARDDQNWWMTEEMPEPGTEVRFVFHRSKTKLHRQRETRLRAERAKKKAGGQ